jgi:deazaflavin-dependent oxidoreductase (nitroreductase family)
VTASDHRTSVKVYNHPRVVKAYNRIISALLRFGVPLGPMALLTVDGRTTGKPRSTPVALRPDGTGWKLTAAYGVGDWVKNLRAAGAATLTVRGRRIQVIATEIAPRAAAPLLRQILADAGPTTRRMLAPYFDTPVDGAIQAWEAEAERHPIFHLEPAHHPRYRPGGPAS